MQINLIDYILKGGLIKIYQIKTEKELENLIHPDWIDNFKGKKTFCYNSNIGIIEILINQYEQIDIDFDHDVATIFLLYRISA